MVTILKIGQLTQALLCGKVACRGHGKERAAPPDTSVVPSEPSAMQVTMSLCWRRLCSRRPSSLL